MKFLKNMKNIKKLWLMDCGITGEGIKELTEGKMIHLNHLALSICEFIIGQNEIGDEGVSYLNRFR